MAAISASGNNPFSSVLSFEALRENDYQRGCALENSGDLQAAFLSYKNAADQGHIEAQFKLGHCYEIGQGVHEDENESARWYQRAAEQGHAQAQFEIGLCYAIGCGVTENSNESIRWYQQAVDQGHPGAQYMLGIVTLDKRAAFELYTKAADQGDVDAQFELGICYEKGEGVNKNEEDAFFWLKSAAEQDHAQAQNYVALFYINGHGVAKDEEAALHWFKEAADQAYGDAEFNLGVCYSLGIGVAKDKNAAIRLFQMAQRNELASYILDYLDQASLDDEAAFRLFQDAASKGNANAQFLLGICYRYGKGVDTAEEEALRWFHMAVDQGISIAQEHIQFHPT